MCLAAFCAENKTIGGEMTIVACFSLNPATIQSFFVFVACGLGNRLQSRATA